ncbi:MAG: ABC-F family ATP-binding cassette domain-containing protein [Bacteroidetes bacterium]|nr:ABC-F family ATP-binding cassette domain-containing protein [Bacteroidota bacterium]MBU1423902.1 ABC-F family ATP-binding cassette domain-containing protein [Bacteroidota bacterium]MBU2471761.1 ABC-F family ATP-binding cassette domain-containing protein [Bacteroidota bacterium]
MILLHNISIQFGGKYLFKNLTVQIGPHDRIGLVGTNGTGKTTLLKILVELAQPDSGAVRKASYVSVGYLPQDGVTSSGKTLYEEAKTAFDNIVAIETQLDEINNQLQNFDAAKNNSEDHQELIEIQGELQHKLESLDAYRMQSQIEKVLMGLGFSVEDFERLTDEFSGGWQMRVALAKLLLSNPSLLLLDEPTNHLDLDSLRWLEDYLKSYNGSIIVVSHDRAFLDNMTNKTLALGNGKLESYAGNYNFFETEQQKRKELLLNAAKNQQQQLKQTRQFIERFRYKATKARQVQSRIKQLEKIDLIEVEGEEKEISFSFPPPKQSGAIVLDIHDLTKRYHTQHGYLTVLENINLTIERGDKIALVGVNGAGKSTLSRILSGTEEQTSGELQFGYNVITSYFAQTQVDELEKDKEVLEVVEAATTGETRTQIRTLLGCFLFEGDDVFKNMAVLSGGEKSRLALAKMLLQPANFLVMDEPTNHLDMRSKKVLQEALKNFEGTYIIVSHDRHFLDPVVNKVIEVRNKSLKTYLGNISDYIEAKNKEEELQRLDSAIQEKDSQNKPAISEKDRKRVEAEERQQLYKTTKPVKDKLTVVESVIKKKEKQKADYEAAMSDPDFYTDPQKVKTINAEYKVINNELSNLYTRWAVLSEELEKLIKSIGKL